MVDMGALKELVGTGRIFSVDFIKRTTGKPRHMVCRTGVKKFVTGGGLKFDPVERDLLSVYDMQKKAYRFINADDLISLTVDGTTIKFKEKKK